MTKPNKLPEAVDEWQAAVDRMVKLCDKMMKAGDYKTAAHVALLRKEFLKHKRPKRKKVSNA